MPEPPRLHRPADVAQLVRLPSEELAWWVVALRERKRYRSFTIARGDGSSRVIDAPIKPLRDIQRRIADELSRCYEAPAHVHGFTSGRSPVSNARAHRGREWVLRVDLKDFFPSINFGRVRGLFMSYPFDYPPLVATLLAQICCFEGRLQQGAPTSPIVSNLICRRLDKEMARLATRENCHLTRYADDLCFSTESAYFPPRLASLDARGASVGPALKTIVTGNGFAINGAKTKLMRRTQRQRVTGLVVNEKANVPREYVRRLRNLLHIWDRYGEADAIEAWQAHGPHRNWPPGKPAPEFRLVVRGQVQHVGSVKGWTSSVYLGLATVLERVDDGFTLIHEAPVANAEPEHRIRLFTEGKTDVLHLLAAQRHFHARGEFLEFELSANDESARQGDQNLLAYCQALAVTRQPEPCLCLFDRDNEDVLAKAVGGDDWKNWGNGVVAVALAGPGGDRVCIEMLHSQETRDILDENGRRLFLGSEFNPRTGQHHSRRFTTPYPGNKALVREYVFPIGEEHQGEREGEDSVALSKAAFAEAIWKESGDFADLDFEGFRLTFEVIREATAAAVKGAA
jgi:RNA-directed DNA polymerase